VLLPQKVLHYCRYASRKYDILTTMNKLKKKTISLRARRLGFDFRQEHETLLFSIALRLALRPTHRPLQLAPGICLRVGLTIHLRLVLRSRMVELYIRFTICLHDIVHIYIIKQINNFASLPSFSLISRNQIGAVLTIRHSCSLPSRRPLTFRRFVSGSWCTFQGYHEQRKIL
jgi:hypothetical protein